MGGAPRGLGGPGTLGGSQKGVWRGDTPPPRSLWGQVTGDGAVLRCPWGGSGGIWGERLFPAAQSLRVQRVLGGSHGVWGGRFWGSQRWFWVLWVHFWGLWGCFGDPGSVFSLHAPFWGSQLHFWGHWGGLEPLGPFWGSLGGVGGPWVLF